MQSWGLSIKLPNYIGTIYITYKTFELLLPFLVKNTLLGGSLTTASCYHVTANTQRISVHNLLDLRLFIYWWYVVLFFKIVVILINKLLL